MSLGLWLWNNSLRISLQDTSKLDRLRREEFDNQAAVLAHPVRGSKARWPRSPSWRANCPFIRINDSRFCRIVPRDIEQ